MYVQAQQWLKDIIIPETRINEDNDTKPPAGTNLISQNEQQREQFNNNIVETMNVSREDEEEGQNGRHVERHVESDKTTYSDTPPNEKKEVPGSSRQDSMN